MDKKRKQETRRAETSKIMKQITEQQNNKTKCSICNHSFDLPVKICAIGHYACASCYQNWSDREKYRITYKDNLPVLNIRKDRDTCLFCPKQCGVFSMQLAKQATDQLIYDLIDHGRERVCEFAGCNEKFVGRAMCDHFFKCPYQTTNCNSCSKRILVTAYKQHLQTECTGFVCTICNVPATYTYTALQVHLKIHKNSGQVRAHIFQYYEELGKLIGSSICGGEMALPIKGTPIDGNDFIDSVALLAFLKQTVQGRKGGAQRLASAIPIPITLLSKLLE